MSTTLENAIAGVGRASALMSDPIMQKRVKRYLMFERHWFMGTFALSAGLLSVLWPLLGPTFMTVLLSSSIPTVSMGVVGYFWEQTLHKQHNGYGLHGAPWRNSITPASASFKVNVIKKAKDANISEALVSKLLTLSRRDDIPASWWMEVDNACPDSEVSPTDELNALHIEQENTLELGDAKIITNTRIGGRYDY